MSAIICPKCRTDSIASQTYVEDITKNFSNLTITNNIYYYCKNCGYMFRNVDKNESSQTLLHLR